MTETIVATKAVSDGEVRRFPDRDPLGEAEVQVLRELATEVHKNGYVGLTWPTVRRVPKAWRHGANGRELFEVDPELADVDEWYVVAEVRVSPR